MKTRVLRNSKIPTDKYYLLQYSPLSQGLCVSLDEIEDTVYKQVVSEQDHETPRGKIKDAVKWFSKWDVLRTL